MIRATKMEFGEKIRRAMADRQISNAWLARQVGCSPENIRKHIAEGTKPGFALGLRIAAVLEVDPFWLGDDKTVYPPPPTEKQQLTETLDRVLAGAGLAGELNEEERELVSGFRSLKGEARGRVLGMIDGLNASNASPPDLNPDVAEEPPPGRK